MSSESPFTPPHSFPSSIIQLQSDICQLEDLRGYDLLCGFPYSQAREIVGVPEYEDVKNIFSYISQKKDWNVSQGAFSCCRPGLLLPFV
jgi:hypothetical protein